jgi:aminoglycoside/choline kinase family phosphotransferase
MSTFPAPATAPRAAVTWPSPEREAAFHRWLTALAPAHGIDCASLAPASSDASFRRYLRVACSGAAASSLVVMDAPPPLEDVRPFVQVARLVGEAGLNAPQVLAADVEHGFLLLTDLGNDLYLPALQAADAATADRLMREAVGALVQFQRHVPADELPPFDAALLQRELALFPEWCVAREFGIRWTEAQRATWQRLVDRLVGSALAQPQVAVHADWMPRNLMRLAPGTQVAPGPGVLDFQDAVRGPITYDIASLLRDAFISWDETQELDWAVRWWQQARQAGLPLGEDFESDFGELWRAIEWMGLQRHLKVMGIFCRLKHRDGKPQYAADLPRFLTYAQKVAMRYGPLKPLLGLLEPLSGARVGSGFTF